MVYMEMSAILFGGYPCRWDCRGQTFPAVADASVEFGVVKTSVVVVVTGVVVGVVVVNVIVVVIMVDGNAIVCERPRLSPHPDPS